MYTSFMQNKAPLALVATGALTTLAFTYFFFDSLMLPKFITLLAGTVAASFFFIKSSSSFTFNPKIVVLLSIGFIISLVVSGLASELGVYQILVGSWARYNGLLSNLLYITLFLIGVFSQSKLLTYLIVETLIYLGYFMVIFALFELSGFNITNIISLDPHLKLTIGNSNFASIIVVITFAATFSRLIHSKRFSLQTFVFLVSSIFHIFLVLQTSATQGLIVMVFAIVFLSSFWFLIKGSHSRQRIGYGFLTLIPIVGFYTLFDFIIRGPLSQVIGINTLIDRYYIWETSILMWRDNVMTGVGIDSFGSWFGQYQQTESLKYKVITENYDNAHNIFLNFLATGGLLVFISYCSITFFIGYCAIQLVRKSTRSANIVALTCIWLVIQIQALVSIDYLSISTWNWIVAGAIVSEYYMSKSDVEAKNIIKKSFSKLRSFQIVARLYLIILIVFSIALLTPTIKAEYKINDLITDKKYVLNSPELQLVNSEILSLALDIKYPDIKIYSVSALETFGDLSGALELAVDSTSRFPRSTLSWATLAHIYEVSGSKKLAAESWKKASELDPLNSIYKAKYSENLK